MSKLLYTPPEYSTVQSKPTNLQVQYRIIHSNIHALAQGHLPPLDVRCLLPPLQVLQVSGRCSRTPDLTRSILPRLQHLCQRRVDHRLQTSSRSGGNAQLHLFTFHLAFRRATTAAAPRSPPLPQLPFEEPPLQATSDPYLIFDGEPPTSCYCLNPT